MPKPEITEKNTKLVPVIASKVLEEYIKEPFGSGSFKMSRSLNRNSYILKYATSSGKVIGSAELVAFHADENPGETYVLLYSSNISGKKEPFKMLFQEIAGKIIPKESELPFFAMFTRREGPGD
ncbi:MAG: hypothetical protein JW839_08195 [Candidatus Lokiarchaeota archaeon]|nr:hypothetical protein [Candidatus Lokiarchaeota archaeon]